MEKTVFRTFMNKNVIQKIIIFTDAFNLNIDGWKPVNRNEHPYRINLYSRNMVVGYIDAVIDGIGPLKYVETDMPFTLFSPFGKITGSFSTHYDLFNYSFENRKESFEKITGLFEVKKFGEMHNEKYSIASRFYYFLLKQLCVMF